MQYHHYALATFAISPAATYTLHILIKKNIYTPHALTNCPARFCQRHSLINHRRVRKLRFTGGGRKGNTQLSLK